MTFAQFKHMKPKYRRRLIVVSLVGFVLCVALLWLLSLGINALRIQLNTKSLDGVTASNVLEKSSMAKILDTMKQSESGNILVMDSVLTLSAKGKVTGLTMNLINLPTQNSAESWRLIATEKKTTLRKFPTVYENMSSRRLRKMEFKTYYPGLSRVTSKQMTEYLTKYAPVGDRGFYTFVDQFESNVEPDYTSYLLNGKTGLWVSRLGALTEVPENFQRPTKCAPAVVSVQEDTGKKKFASNRPVLTDPEEKLIVLFEAAPY